MNHHRIIQVVCVVLAGALLAAAALLQEPNRQAGEKSDVLSVENQAALARSPELGIVNALPGGLRVLAVNWLWIRSQDYHQKGRHYDALQLAEIICQLQPYQAGVWAFQAWNMAYNISVTKQTKEERWQWVYNGAKLLRDRGIPLNPKSLALYKELSWIFFHKIAGRLDESHESYKSRWAGMMQALLGSPPYSSTSKLTLEQETRLVIDAFRPIAEAPLDYDPTRQGRADIQPDQRDVLFQDPQVQAYAEKLAAAGVGIDEGFLSAFNQWSRDDTVEAVRLVPPKPTTDAEKAVSEAINDPAAAAARGKILAFLRAQLLWNRYRLDPRFMLKLMEDYGAPLDWRNALSHGLYWAAYGIDVCKPEDLKGYVTLNNMRNVLNCLKQLTSTGVVTLQMRPEDPAYPIYRESPDVRYIEPTDRQHRKYAEEILAYMREQGKDVEFSQNTLSAGHVNYMIEAMGMLVADGRVVDADGRPTKGTAQYYFDITKRDYRMEAKDWDYADVQEFLVADMQRDPNLRYAVLMELLPLTLKQAYLIRGLQGNDKEYARQVAFAKRLFELYQKDAVRRMKLQEAFDDLQGLVLAQLVLRPRMYGASLNVPQRSDVYLAMTDSPNVLVWTYLLIGNSRSLQSLCRETGLDFNKAFPRPDGFEAYYKKLQAEQQKVRPNQVIPK